MNQEITLEKIYNVVLKLDTRMDRLEIKVDRIEVRLDKLEARVERIEVRLDKMDERISGFEEDMHDLLDATRSTFTNHEVRLATLELA
jgi:predicted  nucleic acid-binding Zn-ribbon protein